MKKPILLGVLSAVFIALMVVDFVKPQAMAQATSSFVRRAGDFMAGNLMFLNSTGPCLDGAGQKDCAKDVSGVWTFTGVTNPTISFNIANDSSTNQRLNFASAASTIYGQSLNNASAIAVALGQGGPALTTVGGRAFNLYSDASTTLLASVRLESGPVWTLEPGSDATEDIGIAGTRWRNLNLSGTITAGGNVLPAGPIDTYFPAYDPLSGVTTTGDLSSTGPTKLASTLQDVNYTQAVAGTGGTTITVKLSSATGGGGTVFATCTPTCTAAVGTKTVCTINTAAIPASTTLFWSIISTTCTTDNAGNYIAHMSEP